MDENLRAKRQIEYSRIGASLSMIAGTVLLTIGFDYFLALSGSSFMDRFLPLLFFIALSAPLIILGVWTNCRAANLKVFLEALDREQKRKGAQQAVRPAAGQLPGYHIALFVAESFS